MIYIMAYDKVTKESVCLEATQSKRGLAKKVREYEEKYGDYGQYGYTIEVETDNK